MLHALVLAFVALTPAPNRTDRLMALARLDAAVRYFHPAVATRPSPWDSLFAANALRIADAPDYARAVAALVDALGDPDTRVVGRVHGQHTPTAAQYRALKYSGFPPASFPSSGGYGLTWRGAAPAESYRVSMGEHVDVDVRLSEPSADTASSATIVPAPTSSPEWRAAYPSAGYRILAAARIWSAIRLFYPYKALIGESWDDQLRAALPAVQGARDSLEYAKAIARFATHIHDTHVSIGSPTLSREVIGWAATGAAARLIENQLVITRIADSSASRAGLRVGDVVVSVDGELVEARIARLTPYMAVSTPQSLRFRLESALLSGRDTTPARLVVRGADRVERVVVVPRSTSYARLLQKQRTGSMIRFMPGNVGYVDLDRLPVTMVDSMFRVLAGTKAIVFDDRGYPLGTAWAIAPRLNTHEGSTTAAKFRRLVVPSPDTARTTVFQFDQPIPPASGAPMYTGRTVMMVDERTISQAEHTGLFFEAANGTTFVGSPSMGANGDVTNFFVPGGISITFTGHDVRHADGRQLQRVGLQPQLAVSPTIAGIRAGRDEVLEAALKSVGGTGEVPLDTLKEAPPPVLIPLSDEPRLAGWGPIGTGSSFRVGADRSVAHGGMASGHVTARSAAPEGFSGFSQSIRADDYRGKRIRFAAWLRTRGVPAGRGTGAGLWMRVDGRGGVMAFDNMSERPVTGNTDWTHVSVVLTIPDDAVGIGLGFLMLGAGEAWIDDATIEVVGADVRETGTMPPTTNPAQVEQQKAEYANAPLALVNLDFERS
jgi:C-terminal processing protease CtpA/Prc